MPAKPMPATRRTYRGEEAWFGLLEEAGHPALRQAFIDCDVSPTIAGQLVWFLEEQRTVTRHLTQSSRTKYRRILERLDPEDVSRAIPRQFKSDELAA